MHDKQRMAALISLFLAAAAATPDWAFVPGSFAPGRGPDGNSVLLDARDGLILVDSGRHAAHRARIEAAAAGRPIVAIVNTHWHLDHTRNNAELRAAAPGLPIVATEGFEAALTGFFPRSRAAAEAYLATGQPPPEQVAEIRADMAGMDAVEHLRPTRPVRRSGSHTIAGRRLELRVADHAVTAADLWIWDPGQRLVIAGDLVTATVPFLDTACPEGWRRTLGEIARLPFATLIPGHGAPMTRAQFEMWRRSFDALLDCAASDAPRERCVDGWSRDAAAFIAADDRSRVARMVGYYIDTRLRAAPAERGRYCPGGPG